MIYRVGINWNRALFGNPWKKSEERQVTFDAGPQSWSPVTSGATVNENTALTNGVVYAAVTLIADGVASLKPQSFTVDHDGTKQRAQVPRWIEKPHPAVRRFEVYNQLLVSALTWGNGYAIIDRRPSDDVIIGMRILHPGRVTCEWHPDRPGFRRYKVDGRGPWLTENDIFHLQGPSCPGEPYGMSVIRQAREAIGLGMSLEEFGARFFGQGAQSKIVLELPQGLYGNSKESAETKARDIIRTFERFHKGRDNWHRPALMTGGAKLHTISISPQDAEFLESRKFQAIEIARWFRVPPHRVGIMDVSTSWGSGLAEENAALLNYTLRPWVSRLEDALTAYAPGGQESGLRIELDTSDFLRGTYAQQVQVMRDLFNDGIISRQEARDELGFPDDGLVANLLSTPQLPAVV